MALLPLQMARVSNLMRGNLATSTLARTQTALLRVQNELTTGKRLNAPSDDPGDGAIAQQIRKLLEQRLAYEGNLKQATSQLSEVDSTLGDLTGLLNEAQTIASANVGSDVTPDQRTAAAAVIDRLYSQVLSLGNKQFNGMFLFAGDRLTDAPFVETVGGAKFVGSGNVLQNVYDENAVLPFQVSGAEVFGALSTRVEGSVDLTPDATLDTRLADLAGVNDRGIAPGIVSIHNGIDPAYLVNLSDANTLGDVVARINAAVPGVTASLAPDGNSLLLTPGAANSLTITEVGGGTTASDLGILQTSPAGVGVPVDGASMQPRLTPLTPLAQLKGGVGFDTTSGIVLTNGLISQTIDFAGATTVEDLLNRINASGTGVKAEINRAGTGINLFNPTQGVAMSIAENGGTTAADLGLRSFAAGTDLSLLNDGRGLRLADGADLRLVDSAGNAVEVDLAGAATVQDVLDRLNTAAAGAGVLVTASFASTGNGIVLTDAAGGAGVMAAASLNGSFAAIDLGIDKPAVGGVVVGTDVAPVKAEGIFANLSALRQALQASDQAAITRAAESLKGDYDRVVRVRGRTGALVQEMDARTERLADQNLASKALLSELEDTDFNDAIIRFTTLQTSLEASMRTMSTSLQMSLMDFLR
jgi:flagellin-like hook-associated protein FlgL